MAREHPVGRPGQGREATGWSDGGRLRLTISSGSYQSAIVERNASSRLEATLLEGFFDHVVYVFAPAPSDRIFQHSERIQVHEVSGDGGRRTPARRLARWQRIIRRLDELVREQRPDVIDVNEPFVHGSIGALLSRRADATFVVNLVSDYHLTYQLSGKKGIRYLPYPVVSSIEQKVLRDSDLVVTDRDYYREYAISRGVAPASVANLPQWVDDQCYDFVPDPNVYARLGTTDPHPLLYVGRVSAEKHPLDLLTALEVARSFDDRRQLVVVGGGELVPDLLREAERRGLRDHLKVKSGLDRRELLSCMASSGSLLATHAGYVLLEAALVGTPVVAYNYEWHPELIIDGQTGFLCSFRDAVTMGVRAAQLVRDRSLANHVAGGLRERAKIRHPRGAAISTQRAVFAELLRT